MVKFSKVTTNRIKNMEKDNLKCLTEQQYEVDGSTVNFKVQVKYLKMEPLPSSDGKMESRS